MLIHSTQIPTAARGKVRALVKAHRHWPLFLRKKGLISASAKNADLIEFALYYPDLATQIEVIITLTRNPAAADTRTRKAMAAFSAGAGIDAKQIKELTAEIEELLRSLSRVAA